MKETVEKTTIDNSKSIEGENRESELTAEQQEKMKKIENGLQQADNEFRKINISDTKEDERVDVVDTDKKEKGKQKVRFGVKAMIFITLITSIGAFASRAEANNLGKAAGEAIERLCDPQRLTLKERHQLNNVMFKNHIKGINALDAEGRSWNKVASDAQKTNLKQRVAEINADRSLTFEQKKLAIERARNGFD